MNLQASGNHMNLPTNFPEYDLRFSFAPKFAWDEGDDGGDGNGDGGDGNSGGDGDQRSKDDGGDGSDDAIKDPDKKRLSDEAAKYRTERNKAAADLEEAQKKLREYEDKDKSELERAQRDVDEFKSKYEASTAELAKLRVENATLKAANSFKFHDLEIAVEQATKRANIKGDEDNLGELLKAALEDLAKEKPFLLKGDDDNEDGEQLPSGSSSSGRKGGKGGLDEEAIIRKFPALQR